MSLRSLYSLLVSVWFLCFFFFFKQFGIFCQKKRFHQTLPIQQYFTACLIDKFFFSSSLHVSNLIWTLISTIFFWDLLAVKLALFFSAFRAPLLSLLFFFPPPTLHVKSRRVKTHYSSAITICTLEGSSEMQVLKGDDQSLTCFTRSSRAPEDSILIFFLFIYLLLAYISLLQKSEID